MAHNICTYMFYFFLVCTFIFGVVSSDDEVEWAPGTAILCLAIMFFAGLGVVLTGGF